MTTETRAAPTVLLVDDDDAFLYAEERELTEAGYRVRLASRYFDALDLVVDPSLHIDALVADVVLDSGNGFALARFARRYHRDLRAIYVTGHSVPTEDVGAVVLRKPVANGAVVNAVRAALSQPAQG